MVCRFEQEKFGASGSQHLQALRDTLLAGLVRELAAQQNANALASAQVRCAGQLTRQCWVLFGSVGRSGRTLLTLPPTDTACARLIRLLACLWSCGCSQRWLSYSCAYASACLAAA